MRTFLRFGFAMIAAAAAMGASAEARYSLCNKSSYALQAAIAYVDGDRLATRGWWLLRPGKCKVVLNEPVAPGRYFVYAEAIPGHKGPLRAWSGDTPLCVENAGFFNLRNQEICREDPLRQRGFFDVEVTAAANGVWQTDFAEPATYSVYSAEVAGVQRLLADIGKTTAPVDGTLGRQTQRDLTAYRRERNLGDGATIDDATFDALIEDANAREAKLGLFLCNKADASVWSAIGEPGRNGEYTSKGWWKLDPGGCAKVIKGELTQDHYYVFGVIEDGRGERRLAGGDRALCINAVRFTSSSATSCADQELDEAMFRRLDIGSANATTFEFKADMFMASPAEPAADAPPSP